MTPKATFGEGLFTAEIIGLDARSATTLICTRACG
jgi:hypothetical protein